MYGEVYVHVSTYTKRGVARSARERKREQAETRRKTHGETAGGKHPKRMFVMESFLYGTSQNDVSIARVLYSHRFVDSLKRGYIHATG